jgi:hypothetical protein
MKTPLLRAIALGFLSTIALGVIANPKPRYSPKGVLLHFPDLMQEMEDGTAGQPFVRRQFVPFLLRAAHDVQPTGSPSKEDQWLASKRLLRPVLFDRAGGKSLDSLVCLIIWFCSFTVFAYTFESEARYYLEQMRGGEGISASTLFLFTSLTCLIVVVLLYNHNYFYDPVTLACAILVMQSLRKERLLALVLLTVIFALNRETAFIVPGLAFFYWLHLHRMKRALGEAALLSGIYLLVAGSILFHYRHNHGQLATNHRAFLIHMYVHEKLPFTVAAFLALTVYGIAVIRHWDALPAVLKAIQWFIPLWMAMHILWGWPMEWRVFFEVYPGIMLTVAALWGMQRKPVALTKLQLSSPLAA